MVTQETHLFHDTIRTNLLYARAEANQAELEAACRAANIHDFIAGLPTTSLLDYRMVMTLSLVNVATDSAAAKNSESP